MVSRELRAKPSTSSCSLQKFSGLFFSFKTWTLERRLQGNLKTLLSAQEKLLIRMTHAKFKTRAQCIMHIVKDGPEQNLILRLLKSEAYAETFHTQAERTD